MQTCKVIIECLKGSNEKFELDEKDGQIKLDFVFRDLVFPFYYGYIPGTRAGDGDMIDAVVLSSKDLSRGQEIECRTIGYVEIVDRGEEDNKFIMLPVNDLTLGQYQDIFDLPNEELKKWEDFWREAAKQKQKVMEVKRFMGKNVALQLLQKF